MLSLILALQSVYIVSTVPPIKSVLAFIARTPLTQRGTLLLLLVASDIGRSLHSQRRHNVFPRQWLKALMMILLFTTHYVSHLKFSVNKLMFHSLKLEFFYTKLFLYKYWFILSLFPRRVDDIFNKKDNNYYSDLKQQQQHPPLAPTQPPIPTHIPTTEIKISTTFLPKTGWFFFLWVHVETLQKQHTVHPKHWLFRTNVSGRNSFWISCFC